MHSLDDDPSPGTGLPNVIALIDVLLFLLLAQLAGAARAQEEHALAARLAPADSAAKFEQGSKLLKVTVTAGGEYWVGRHRTDAAGLRARIERLPPGSIVVVQGDRDARLAAVVKIMAAANKPDLKCVLQVQKEEKP